MAAARTPGPLGTSGLLASLDDGTLIRALSPVPGPVGLAPMPPLAAAHAVFLPPRPVRRETGASAMPLLRQGGRGPDVERLQRLVNQRSLPSPGLRVDGVFGPITLQALKLFQAAVSIAGDGVAGKDTWFHLLKADKPTPVQVPARPAAPAPRAAPAPATGATPPPTATLAAAPPASASAAAIADWPLADKFAEVLRRTAPKLPGSMAHEFAALLSPTSLGIMAGTLVVWAGSHAFGVGEVVDLVLLAGGAFFLGMAVFDVAGELGEFLLATSDATDSRGLDDAATHLARAIAIMGVAAFIALLAKVASGKGGTGKGGASEVPPKAPAAQKPPAARRPAKPAPEPTPGKAPTNAPTNAPVKFGKRGRNTEPGAEPPTKAVLQEMSEAKMRAEHPPPARPGWPEIDAGAAATFKNPPDAVALSKGDKLYRIIDSESNPNGGYWTTNNPRTMTEAQWRSGAAVKGEWNGDGAFVEYEVPKGGLKVWAGEAAPQMSSDGANVLRGGGNQVWVPPGSLQASPPISTGF